MCVSNVATAKNTAFCAQLLGIANCCAFLGLVPADGRALFRSMLEAAAAASTEEGGAAGLTAV